MSKMKQLPNPFSLKKGVKLTLGRRQAERADTICNELGMTPEQIIKREIVNKSALLKIS